MGDNEIRQAFLTEAKEIIENLESDIVQLEENAGDREIINRIFRYFHTLKGSSGIAGFTEVYEFSHKIENLLDAVRGGKIEVTDSLIDLILDSMDWIRDSIFTEGEGDAAMNERKSILLGKVGEFKKPDASVEKPLKSEDAAKARAAAHEKEDAANKYKYYRVRASFIEKIFEFGIDPLMVMEDLASHGPIIKNIVDKQNLPEFEGIDPEKCYLSWDIIIKSKSALNQINDVFIFVKDENKITVEDVTSQYMSEEKLHAPVYEKKLGEIMLESGIISENELDEAIALQNVEGKRFGDIIVNKGFASEEEVEHAIKEQAILKKKVENTTVRVDTVRLDNILNLLGEIVIGQSSLSRIAHEMENDYGTQLKNIIYGLDRTTREFQEQIMSIRMIPIGPTFNQFRRFVRDIAHSLHKEMKFVLEGEETELDKTVIERIDDPLKHMIRNSIDHGIEQPEERVKAGKDPAGTITLKAYHQEGNVFIEVNDDGKGIDEERVREKAISMNLIKPDEEASREKLLSFLFMPGFSTAKKVGDLSGRGVGMDVVKTNIESLRGSVEIRSEKGRGSSVKIKLPLTLAIIDGMLTKTGNNTYIIPLLSVMETIRPAREDIKTIEGKGEVVSYRGEYLSLIRLYEIFNIKPRYENPWEALVVIVESGRTKVGLLIDDMIGQQQIVIKSLDNYITQSRAVSGASILGDGKVALIIDIFGLMEDVVSA